MTAVTPKTEGGTESECSCTLREQAMWLSRKGSSARTWWKLWDNHVRENGWSGGLDGSLELMAISALGCSGVMNHAWWGCEGHGA